MRILDYIKNMWTALRRSHQDLAAMVVDSKAQPSANRRWPLYVPGNQEFRRVEQELRRQMKAADFDKLDVRPLPPDRGRICEHGILYLPRPYVVPGGRFNEMYGWDSYFIQMGLLRDGRLELARDMAENFLYEIREYGKILNANRTYYLTRSQPPFLTEMLLAVYRKTGDRSWLAESVDAIEKCYRFWTSEPHLTPETGLSRYFDTGEGPAPEVVSSELDAQGRTNYDLAKLYFHRHHIEDYDVSRFYKAGEDRLTAAFYKGDRSMRESGFDPSDRFGPFNADIIHYNPVCLNSLLYLMETQAAEIMDILGRGHEADRWRKLAEERAARMNGLMWDESAGMYFDYDFAHRRVRHYPFLTTFYPLWTGVAGRARAARVVSNLSLFERPGGLQTSTTVSGDQWDSPFGWAPLQWIAVQALRRYGYGAEADRVSRRFLALVLSEFVRQGTILEKYDVVHPHADVARALRFGYRSNEAGFGWTNAVFTALWDELPSALRSELGSEPATSR